MSKKRQGDIFYLTSEKCIGKLKHTPVLYEVHTVLIFVLEISYIFLI